MRRPTRHAFTLLELLIVIFVLGIIAVFAWPEFGEVARAENLRESARRVQTLIAMSRAEAMRDTVRFRMRIRQDGALAVQEQAQPLRAPHLYISPRRPWARTDVLLPDVWIEGVQVLPEGPAPIQIIDDELQFPEMDFEPVRVEDLEQPLDVTFDPSGTSNSVRLILRDTRGRGLLLTLDGRLGACKVEDWPAVSADEARRPEPLEPEEEPEY
ncbi:MAG: prepilin-type N-terminal cleavage/methylation domain-containing protein, partial [Planctomycetota bacterium]